MSIALGLLLGTLGSLALAANQNVTSTGDNPATAGTLPYAVDNVGPGENVGFQPDIAGQTVNLSSDLGVGQSMNFVNGSGGLVTVDLNGNMVDVSAACATLSIDSGLTFQTTTGNSVVGRGLSISGSSSIEGLAGNISASAIGDNNSLARGIWAIGGLRISGGLSGSVSASSIANFGAAHGIVAFSPTPTGSPVVSISGGLSGTISASAGGTNALAVGILAVDDDLVIAGGLSGTVSATAANGTAYGLVAANSSLNGGDSNTPLEISGSVTANGGTAAVAVVADRVNLRLNDGGTLSATSSGGEAIAVRSDGTDSDTVELVAGCTIEGDIDLGDGTGDTLTLSGTNGTSTYNGDVTGVESFNVTGGTWNFNGQTSSNLNVSGGTLGGTAQIGNLINSGTVAPGNSIGTLTVGGNYTQNAGSTLEIEINDAGASDLVDIAGKATINGGTVDVVAESGDYSDGMTYTFLDADGGRTGEFDSVTDNLPFLDAILEYGTNDVRILLQTSHTPFIDVAQTFNQRGVASYLDDHYAGATGDFATVLGELDTLTAPDARKAFGAMGGELHASLSTVCIENTDRLLRTVARRLRGRSLSRGLSFSDLLASDDARTSWHDSQTVLRGQSPSGRFGGLGDGWDSWAEGYGVGAQIGGNANVSGLTFSTGGMAFGLERSVDHRTTAGLFAGYANTGVALDARGDHAAIDSAQIGLYLHRAIHEGYATAIVLYGHNDYDSTRQVTLGNITRSAEAVHGGNEFSFYTELGRNYYFRKVHLQPYTALQYIQLHQDGFVESGAQSMNLSVGGIQADAFRGLLGTRLVGYFQTDAGRPISIEGRALWRHEFLDEARVLGAVMSGQPGGAFVVDGVNVDRDVAILGSGLTFHLAEGMQLFANYNILASQNYTAHVGIGGLNFNW